MIYFYVRNYRIEIRKVKNKKKWNRKFLFLKYVQEKPSRICKSCPDNRLQYKYCRHGLSQYNRKTCSSLKSEDIKTKEFAKMKEFEPELHEIVYCIILEDTNDLFIDIKHLEAYETSDNRFNRSFYKEVVSKITEFGTDVFIFDIEACEFFKEN